MRGTEFLINGDPFYFKGFGMHEDHATIGKAHSNAHLVQDFELLDWVGANSFRTSHYPYSEDVLDYADRHGIVIIDETAAVGLNMGLGGGIFGGQGYTTFSAETINESSREVHAQAIRELIARDKNHPSVVLWSIANEPESDTEAAEDYFRPLFDVARDADPTRPVGFVNVMLAPARHVPRLRSSPTCSCSTATTAGTSTPVTSPAPRSRWRAELRGLGVRGQADHHHRVRRRHPGRHHSLTPQPWSEEYQVDYLDMNHRVFDASMPWSASTSGTSPTSRRPPASCGSTATRRVPSPATASRRPPPSRSVAVGARTPEDLGRAEALRRRCPPSAGVARALGARP